MAKQLTLEEAKAGLQEAIAAFNEPATSQKITELKTAAGPDIIKFMTTVTPVAIAVASPVVAKHGFDGNQLGVTQFIFAIQAHASDPEISQQIAQFKAQVLPPNFQIPPAFAAAQQPPK